MTLEARIGAALGAEVTRLTRLHGGDLSDVRRAELSDGRHVVAKTGPLVATEAQMLRVIGRHAPAPGVIHAEPGLMLLDYLEESLPSGAGWARLGDTLRALHGVHADSYGWPADYAFGQVSIPNRQTGDWPAFWAENRLLAAPDALPRDLRQRIEALCTRLPQLLPRTPPASLLHGDLWSGNLLFSGKDCYLIDPAAYHGHAEVDLAMLSLFGTPPQPFWEAYGPLEDGAGERRAIYQLWPALVHLRLFGGGYRGMVADRLALLGA